MINRLENEMSDIQLYWFWSTNPQKVRFALEEMELPYTLHKINLGQGAHKTPEYRMINPREQVPALSIDGKIICESNAILLTLATRFQKLWPQDPQEQSRAMELLFFENGTFSSLAGTHYYNLVIRPRLGTAPNIPAIQKAKKRLTPHLNRLENHFAQGPTYLLSEFSIVDCAFSVWLPHINLDEHPYLLSWRQRLMNRSGWSKAELHQKITQQPSGEAL
jgi:glutathione S-transferase